MTETYSYAGSDETVVRIANPGGTVDSIVDAMGDRLGAKSGTTLNWFLPDPHGNVAAALTASEAAVANATRYDPWGEIAATGQGTGGGTPVAPSAWTYQGRLDLSPPGAEPLLDYGARFYAPELGAFTSLDPVMGGAQNPLTSPSQGRRGHRGRGPGRHPDSLA